MNENRTYTDLWAARTWFLFGFGGISVLFREQADKGVLHWIFPAVAGSIAMLWAPYALLMFSLNYAGKVPKSLKRRTLTAIFVSLPIIIFYFAIPALEMFGHAESQLAQDIHLRIMTILIAPYYVGSALLITRNMFRKTEQFRQTENISTFLIAVPTTLSYYFFAYIVPCFGNLDGWKASIYIMFVVSFLFLYSVVKKNAFGLCFQQQNNSRERVEETVIEGTGVLQNAMQNNLISVQQALQNAKLRCLSEECDMESVMQNVQAALESCENSLSILERIRLKIHPVRFKLSACRLIPIIEQVIDQSQNDKANQNVRIVREFTANPMLYCDPAHIREVILNLVNNAIEAIPADGSGLLVISVSKSKYKAKIQIHDNGSGIDKYQLNRLGIPLLTSKDEGSHYGLGLYYVKKVIDMHNGLFTLKKSCHGGALAEIILPITHDE